MASVPNRPWFAHFNATDSNRVTTNNRICYMPLPLFIGQFKSKYFISFNLYHLTYTHLPNNQSSIHIIEQHRQNIPCTFHRSKCRPTIRPGISVNLGQRPSGQALPHIDFVWRMNVVVKIQIDCYCHACVRHIHRAPLFLAGIRPCVATPLRKLHIIKRQIRTPPSTSPALNKCPHFVGIIARVFTSATVGLRLIPNGTANRIRNNGSDSSVVNCPGEPSVTANKCPAPHGLDCLKIPRLRQLG